MEENQINTPFFSIIIATFNVEKTLERCLDSIIQQRFADREILIQDGGSTDRTKNIIDAYHNEIAYFESHQDKGIYDAWNKALPRARGVWICFLGADDYFTDKTVLSNYFRFLKQVSATTKVVYGINHVLNSAGEKLYAIGKPWQEMRSQFFKTMCLPHQGLMHHRTVFDDVGLFNDTYTIAGDYELLLRVFKNNPPEFWPYPVCQTPLEGISTAPKNHLICLKEIKRAKAENGLKGNSLLSFKLWVGAVTRLMMWEILGEKNGRALLDTLRKVRGLDPFWARSV